MTLYSYTSFFEVQLLIIKCFYFMYPDYPVFEWSTTFDQVFFMFFKAD